MDLQDSSVGPKPLSRLTGSGAPKVNGIYAVQELSNILEALASQRASSGAAIDDANRAEDVAPDDDEDADSAGADISSVKAPAGLLQTFVFSATLTLPQKLRKRLRRGGLLCITYVSSFP